MIKVNLLRDTTATGVQISKESTAFGGTSVGDGTRFGAAEGSDSKDIIMKLVFMILPVIGSFGYLNVVEGQKNDEINRIQVEIQSKTQKVQQLGPAIESVQNFKKERERLQQQIETIKKLSRERLKNVKALEALQNLMPERAWLKSMKLKEALVEFEGAATDDRVVADFMSNLERNIYFSNVRLVKTSEQTTNDGVVKNFSVSCSLEGM